MSHLKLGKTEQADYRCPDCGFTIWIPIGSMEVAEAGLYDDARFPGRSILALREHVTDFQNLSGDQADQFFKDSRNLALAIQNVTGAKRMNYAILGNREPHLHAHLIPRGGPEDQVAHLSPWQHPQEVRTIAESDRLSLVKALRAEIKRS